MGLNPTVIGMQDNGLYYLFDMLLQGKQYSNSYDPTYSYVHVTLTYLQEINVDSIEQQINTGLERDTYTGNTVAETFDNEVITVCIYDDLAFLDNPLKAIEAADILVRRYRGALKFIFIIEEPLFLNQFKDQIPPTSIFWDSINYQEIGRHWNLESLSEIIGAELNVKIDKKIMEKIIYESNLYYGLVKRKYRDFLLGQKTADRFAQSVFSNMKKEVQLALKKVIQGKELNQDEEEIAKSYENVGFLKHGKVNIPEFETIITQTTVKREISINEQQKIQGIDFDLLSKSERAIIKALLESGEVIPKSKIGDIIWKDQVNDKYSEWAIDQRIARLRKKIIDLGFNIDVQTIYGKGYQIAFIE